MLKILFKLIIAITVLACTGCASYLRIDGSYEGRIIDAESNLPIEGAVVHGSWWQSVYAFGIGGMDYYDSREVLTDKNGEFKIRGQGLLVLTSIFEMDLTILKAGYKYWKQVEWEGLKCGKWPNCEVTWDGNKPTIRLKKMTMERRRERIITAPISTPARKLKLFRREQNREIIEIGLGKEYLFPEE